jgi:hypothetical protein
MNQQNRRRSESESGAHYFTRPPPMKSDPLTVPKAALQKIAEIESLGRAQATAAAKLLAADDTVERTKRETAGDLLGADDNRMGQATERLAKDLASQLALRTVVDNADRQMRVIAFGLAKIMIEFEREVMGLLNANLDEARRLVGERIGSLYGEADRLHEAISASDLVKDAAAIQRRRPFGISVDPASTELHPSDTAEGVIAYSRALEKLAADANAFAARLKKFSAAA